VDYIIQGTYGWYDFDVDMNLAPAQQNVGVAPVPLGGGLVPLPQVNANFNFHNAVGGGLNGNLNNLFVTVIFAQPGSKALPVGIAQLCNKYWNISTTLSSYTTDITFDLTGSPFGNPAKWRILHRPNATTDWQIWNDYTLVSANEIRANGVSSLSEWTVGATEPVLLPVTLSSFTGIANQNGSIKLMWTTQSETDMSGFRIYRNSDNLLSHALCLTPSLISATNASTATDYMFIDNQDLTQGTWNYWLEAMNNDGTSLFFGPITITLTMEGEDNPPPVIPGLMAEIVNYPNPFNPNTTISVYLPSQDRATLSVYNTRGELVYAVPCSDYNAGWHRFSFNAVDRAGKALSSGVYLVKLAGHNYKLSKKMQLIK